MTGAAYYSGMLSTRPKGYHHPVSGGLWKITVRSLHQSAECDGELVACARYGAVPGTEDRYELYWIAVARDLQGKGVGSLRPLAAFD